MWSDCSRSSAPTTWNGWGSRCSTPSSRRYWTSSSTPEGTPRHAEARDKLIEYFAESWNGRAGPKTTGEENPYFKLVEEAHRRGTWTYAIEGATVAYLLFRYGEAHFGGSVRSYLWATHVPATGRCIIFGGGAHFNSPGAGNVQDYLAQLSPERLLVSLTDLLAEAGT